jgi:nucleoside-diphosphate-sugar epimerase
MGELLHMAICLSGVKARFDLLPPSCAGAMKKIIFGRTTKFHKDTGWKSLRSITQTLAAMLEYWDRMM